MKVMVKKILHMVQRFIIGAAALAMAIIQAFPQPAMALSLREPTTAWMRAKLTYEYDDGIKGLSDDLVTFNSDKWKKSGEWYYYQEPVESGQRIRFIDSVKIPTDWGNDLSDKEFRIIVSVEASEVMKGETGWNENNKSSYAESFDLWNSKYEHGEDVYIDEGSLKVSIHEYELDENGKEVTYKNNKVITPGQKISKIVEFEISGEKGARVTMKPEKPVKTVRCDNIDVNGKTVEQGSTLVYGITVKNPAPDMRTITIRDDVDDRLTIVDCIEGTLTEGSINGKGGTIEWSVNVPGGEEYTVNFIVRAPEGIEEKGMSIPNTASAQIVGKDLDTNTVIVFLGDVSPLVKVITRATGDASHIWLYVGLFGVALIAVAAIAVHTVKKKKWK